jgi:Uma2 family endonuclease
VVRSKATRLYDLEHKRPTYRQAGVPELRFYDPEAGELNDGRRQGDGIYATPLQQKGRYQAQMPAGFKLQMPISSQIDL